MVQERTVSQGADIPGPAARHAPLPSLPTQARGVEKRDRLYDAAMARYREGGVANTKVEDVIAEAGVSWATFFRYFPRKEDVLLEGVARHFRDHVRPTAQRSLADHRLRTRTVLERALGALLEPVDMPRPLHIAALLEVLASPPRFAAFVGDHPQPVIGLVGEILAEGQRRGEVRTDVDASLAAVALGAGTMFPAAQAAAAGADPMDSAKRALDLLWGGLASP
jgi:AcrR family transcriptional regulator